MPNPEVQIPHFQVPFNLSAAGAAVVEQSSDEDVVQCIQAICRTPRGTRLDSPDFGIDEVVLRERGPDHDRLIRTIEFWEPRARATIDISQPNTIDQLYTLVEINVGGAF